MEAILLPFLKRKDATNAGIVMKTREPDEKPQENQDDSSAGIESCAQELLQAINEGNPKAMAQALKDAFDILESMPYDESPEPHSYDSQSED